MITIIVPVYNAESYLKRCVESILAQSIQSIQVILVNDGSADNSGKMCDAYALQDSRIEVIHQENMGQVAARNAGIRSARGNYIGFVDADDWIEKDMYEALYREALLYDAEIVMEGVLETVGEEIFPSYNVIRPGVYQSQKQMDYIHENVLSCEEYFKLGIQPYLWNKLFKRSLVERIMPDLNMKMRVGEDAVAVFKMVMAAKCIVIKKSTHYHYCVRNNSVMLQGLSQAEELESVRACYIALLESIKKKQGREMEKVVRRYVIHLLLMRVYERLANMRKGTVLFPFGEVAKGASVFIYGAGGLGQAIYRYAACAGDVYIKGWLDSNAKKYQQLGMPVKKLEDVVIDDEDVVIVAVFSNRQSEQIRERLRMINVDDTQIRAVCISEEEEDDMIKVCLRGE